MARRKRAAAGAESALFQIDLLDGLNPEQKQVVLAHEGAFQVLAGAGAGKTHSLVKRVAYLIAERGESPSQILAVTFSKKAADEMNDRLSKLGIDTESSGGCRVGTWHSLALQILREDSVEHRAWLRNIDDKDRFRIIVKSILGYQGMKWSTADLTEVLSFIGLCKANLAEAGSPRAVEVARVFWKEKPCTQRDPALLNEAYSRATVEQMEQRLLTFDDMLVFAWRLFQDNPGVREKWASRYRFLIQDEAQDSNVAQAELAAILASEHRNYMIIGDPAQCHPPGTMIDTGTGWVPVEELETGNVVRGWNQNAQKMIGGREIEVSKREYRGLLIKTCVNGRVVETTPNHRFVARWADRKSKVNVVYLMWRRDRGYRVGWCKLFANDAKSDSFHLAQRARIEKAEAVWILSVHSDRTEASVRESVIAARFGIPTATFEPVHGAIHQTEESIVKIFSSLDRQTQDGRGEDCLRSFGRDPKLPLYPWPGSTADSPQGRRTIFQVYASNLIPGLMNVPLPEGRSNWKPVAHIEYREYEGLVYSMNVEKDETYSANGIVVHNSIYKFRGAVPEKFMAFANEWAPVTVIRMNRNYRSGRQVIAAANQVASSMKPGTNLGVDMLPERGSEASIQVLRFPSFDEEGQEIADRIRANHASGVEWRDMAVLYRTNAQSRGVEEALLSSRIPYVVIGGTNFYERKEVKDLLAYLRIASGRGADDDFRRSINSPFRFLGKAFVERVTGLYTPGQPWSDVVRQAAKLSGTQRRQATSANEWAALIDSLSDSIQKLEVLKKEFEDDHRFEDHKFPTSKDIDTTLRIPTGRNPEGDIEEERNTIHMELIPRHYMPAALLERIIRETDYTRYITRDEGSESVENNRVSNIRELVRASERFKSVGELLDYIDENIRATKEARNGDQNRVTLCSLHRSKGLEWGYVALIGCNEKILPHARTRDIEEERRLFYVGVTRARDTLHITHVESAAVEQGSTALEPSRFLSEAFPELDR